MRVLLVLAHPRPGSFNHALAEAARGALLEAGHDAVLHDLYAERFDPVLPAAEVRGAPDDPLVRRHCEEVAAADGLVLVHPNWWGQPPAILKGWVDRVLRAGVAYRFAEGDGGEGVPVGLLRARQAVVLNTSDTPPERERREFGDPLDTLWRNCILRYCGVEGVERITYGVVVTSTPAERAAWLADARRRVEAAFPRAAGA